MNYMQKGFQNWLFYPTAAMPDAIRCSVPHAEQRVYAVVRTGCTLLQQTDGKQKAVAYLQQLRGLMRDGSRELFLEIQSNDDQDDLEKELRSAVAALHSLGLSTNQVLCCLYWGSSVELLFDTLLSVVAPVWLPSMTLQEQECLFQPFFNNCPTPVLLTCLLSHLGLVTPAAAGQESSRQRNGKGANRHTSSSSVHVSPVSSKAAALMLCSRLVGTPDNGVMPGVADLVNYLARAPLQPESLLSNTAAGLVSTGEMDGTALLLPHIVFASTSGASTTQWQGLLHSGCWQGYMRLVGRGPGQVVSLLASLPDRAAPVQAQEQDRTGRDYQQLTCLQASQFYPHILHSLLTLAVQPDDQQQQQQQQVPPCSRQAPCAAWLLSELALKLCARGATSDVVALLIACSQALDSGDLGHLQLQALGTLGAAASAPIKQESVASITHDAAVASPPGSSTQPVLADSPAALHRLCRLSQGLVTLLVNEPGLAEKLVVGLLCAVAQASPAYATAPPLLPPTSGASVTPSPAAPALSWQLPGWAPHHLAAWMIGHSIQGVRDAQAVRTLTWLLGSRAPGGPLSHPDLQYLMTERLYSGGRTLPSSALHLLTDLVWVLLNPAEPGEDEEKVDPGCGSPGHQQPGEDGATTLTAAAADEAWWRHQLEHGNVGARPGTGEDHQVEDLFTCCPGVSYPQLVSGVAQGWGDEGGGVTGASQQQASLRATARAGTALPQQAYVCAALCALLRRLDRPQLEHTPGLLGSLLSGVSLRLSSPLSSVRRQGMRVGRQLALCLDSQSSLFGEGEGQDQSSSNRGGEVPLEVLAQEEVWPGAQPTATQAVTGAQPGYGQAKHPSSLVSEAAPSGGGRGHATQQAVDEDGLVEDADDSDADDRSQSGEEAEADSDDEDEELHPLMEDTSIDARAEDWAKADPQLLQLRSLAAALRKQDDVKGVLAGLGRIEVLIRSCPDELGPSAHELSRALLYCRVPEWAEVEDPRPEDLPALQRLRALAALTACAPLQGGDSLIAEVYSPHLDIYQRLLILDVLGAAAQELAHPETAPQVEATPGGAPRLAYGPPATQGTAARALPSRDAPGGGGGKSLGRTRVWGHVALAKQGQAKQPTTRNLFANVAMRWTAGLLREVDKVKHGVNLLGRDTLVFSRVLATLGTFAECSTATDAALPVACAVLELIASPEVHGHCEPGVRRCALLAAGQVLAALPAPRIAGALLGTSRDPSDAGLVDRLQWIKGWLSIVGEEDGDETCRSMAAACSQLHGALAAEALTSLTALPSTSSWPSSQGGATGVLGQDVGAGDLVQGPLGLVRRGVVLPSATSGSQVLIGEGGGIVVPGIGLKPTTVTEGSVHRSQQLSVKTGRGSAPLITEV